MHIDIIIESHVTKILMNSNNEINLMSIQLTRKLNLISIMTKNIIVFIINDKRLKTYDVHFLNMKIIDRKRHIRYFNEFFLTSNITHERVVRDMS